MAHTLKDWADRLDRIIQDGVRAVNARRGDDVAAAQRKLREFKRDSPAFADSLDHVATLAIFDLDLGLTDAAIAGLRDRSQQVYRLTKLIDGVAGEAKTGAAALRGEAIKSAIDSTTDAVRSLRELAGQLSNKGDEAKLAADIDKLIDLAQSVRDRAETL